ncbi:MAG TPA: peroxiredoxin [Marmoricola sp.]|nr:peroxiredoxin [Marmoricola sp.]
MTPLQVGDVAPDFTLLDQHGQEVALSPFRDEKAVLVVFYPFAFSGICTGELTGFRDRLGDFETADTTLVAISCDPIYTQRALADRDGIFFPLLADYWPHGAVTTSYGVFDERQGCPRRSSFVVDKAGRVGWVLHNPMGEARDLDEHAAALVRVGGAV